MAINVNRKTGQLNRTEPTEDAVVCHVITGAAVAGKIALSEPKQIYGTDALETLGITDVNNPLAYKEITEFYGIAGEGAEFNFMLVSDATLLADICNKANQLAKKLLDFTNGRGVILFVSKKLPQGYVSAKTNGLETDVWNAVTKMQELANAFIAQNVPFVGILPGIGFTTAGIANLPARSTLANDNVALNFFCSANDGIISNGILSGVLAKMQVHQNAGRVASGKVSDTAFFPDGTSASDPAIVAARAALDLKGILFPVKVGGKSGYFFNDDPTLTAISSDYSSISWNRTINKAHRIAYTVLVEKDHDDVEVNEETGKIETSLASDWESDVENAIRAQMMRASGNKKTEISGVSCTVDPDSDIVNDEVDVDLTIVRKGQAKTINLNIGFGTTV